MIECFAQISFETKEKAKTYDIPVLPPMASYNTN